MIPDYDAVLSLFIDGQWIGGSIWMMYHLNTNMMPMPDSGMRMAPVR